MRLLIMMSKLDLIIGGVNAEWAGCIREYLNDGVCIAMA